MAVPAIPTIGSGTIGSGMLGDPGASSGIGTGTIGSGTLGDPDTSTGSGSIGSGSIGSGTIGDPTAGGAPTSGGGVQVLGAAAMLVLSASAGSVDSFAIDRSNGGLSLGLYDPIVRTQPGLLHVAVGNGTPGQTIYFFIDGTRTVNAGLDDAGRITSLYLSIDGLTAGDHQVGIATSPATATLTQTFTTRTEAPAPEDDPLPQEPDLPTAVDRWTFQGYYKNDLGQFDSYTLPRNPSTWTQAYGDSSISSEPVTAGGRLLSWQGSPTTLQWSFDGHVLDEAEYQAMRYWGTRNRRMYLTNHFGERSLVAVDGITFQRVRDPARPWHQTYTMTVNIIPPNTYVARRL